MEKNNSNNFKKEHKKIKRFSLLIEKKIGRLSRQEQKKIENLTFDQLQDLNKLTSAANYILTKYENNLEVYSLLKQFVDMINNSSNSMDLLNDKINEMVLTAGTAISKIKNLQGDISENYSVKPSKDQNDEIQGFFTPESSTNNLTKSTTPVYT